MPDAVHHRFLAIDVPAYSYDSGFRLQGIRVEFGAGGLVALIGPNGSGKSTLLKLTAGLIHAAGVSIVVQGQLLHELAPRAAARLISWVPQRAEVLFSMTVREMVRIGRYRLLRPLRDLPREDETIIEKAVGEVGLTEMLDRDVDTLSGGEWQRALIARALAQDTPVMLLDEPVASLDLRYQDEVYLLLKGLATKGRLIIVADHHLEVAASYAERIVMLNAGGIAADGVACDVLTSKRLAEVYGVEVRVFPDPVSGTPRLSRPRGDRT